MTDQTNDPVAAAAAQLEQQAAQPSSTEPSAPVVAQTGEQSAAIASLSGANSSSGAPISPEPATRWTPGASVVYAVNVTNDVPNAAPAVVEQPITPPSAPVASTPAGIVGIAASSVAEPSASLSPSIANTIRAHIANLKQHLRLRGFEEEVVTALHKELDAIEKWL